MFGSGPLKHGEGFQAAAGVPLYVKGQLLSDGRCGRLDMR